MMFRYSEYREIH